MGGPAPSTGVVVSPEAPQVKQVPVGGAGIGVAVEPTGTSATVAVAGAQALAVLTHQVVDDRRDLRVECGVV
jgi:DNA-binding beta-propeller fold protein YncE